MSGILINEVNYTNFGDNPANQASAISYVNTVSGLQATNAQDAIDEVDAAVDELDATVSGLSTTVSSHSTTISSLGTASTKDVPSSGNASSTQVVLGSDTRLTNKREPSSHASTGTGYGIGNASNYGHIKLSDTYSSSVGNASQAIGASQKAVYDVYNLLTKTKTYTPQIIDGRANTENFFVDITRYGKIAFVNVDFFIAKQLAAGTIVDVVSGFPAPPYRLNVFINGIPFVIGETGILSLWFAPNVVSPGAWIFNSFTYITKDA